MSLYPSLNKCFYSWFSGCQNYSLPRHLQRRVDLIEPTVHLKYPPVQNALLKHTGGLGQPSGFGPETSGSPGTITTSLTNSSEQITPDCLRALYKIDYTPCSTDDNTFGIGSLRYCRLLTSILHRRWIRQLT